MSAIIMDGRAVSEQLMPELKRHVKEIKEKYNWTPHLAAILVGDDPASRQYVRNKQRYAAELGLGSELITMSSEEASTESLLKLIQRLNRDPRIAGILLQLPLPEHVDRFRLFDAIDPLKDVDAVSSTVVGGFYRGQWGLFIPCTPRGVLTLLDYYKVPVEGARAVVIGRSDIAGKPLALILGGRLRDRRRISPGGQGTFRRRRRFRKRQRSGRMDHAQSGWHGTDDSVSADAKFNRRCPLHARSGTCLLLSMTHFAAEALGATFGFQA